MGRCSNPAVTIATYNFWPPPQDRVSENGVTPSLLRGFSIATHSARLLSCGDWKRQATRTRGLTLKTVSESETAGETAFFLNHTKAPGRDIRCIKAFPEPSVLLENGSNPRERSRDEGRANQPSRGLARATAFSQDSSGTRQGEHKRIAVEDTKRRTSAFSDAAAVVTFRRAAELCCGGSRVTGRRDAHFFDLSPLSSPRPRRKSRAGFSVLTSHSPRPSESGLPAW